MAPLPPVSLTITRVEPLATQLLLPYYVQGTVAGIMMKYDFLGARMACWLERRTRDRKVASSNHLQERRENFLLQSQLYLLTYSVSVPPLRYRSGT